MLKMRSRDLSVYILVILFLQACFVHVATSKKQVMVQGRISCGGRPYNGAGVKLFDKSKKIQLLFSQLVIFNR